MRDGAQFVINWRKGKKTIYRSLADNWESHLMSTSDFKCRLSRTLNKNNLFVWFQAINFYEEI